MFSHAGARAPRPHIVFLARPVDHGSVPSGTAERASVAPDRLQRIHGDAAKL
jgi:hypothetical protein